MKKRFTFRSKDGHTDLFAVKYIPEDVTPRGVLQITHGMVEHIGRYDEFATFMMEQGFVVVGHDHLGHGRSVLRKRPKNVPGPKTAQGAPKKPVHPDLGYFYEYAPSDILVEDMHTLRIITQEEFPTLPYFMLGHSMGSYLLRKYIALHGENLAGAILSGTGHVDPGTAEMALKLISAMEKIHGSRYRSSLIQKLTFGKSYRGFDMDGSHPEKSWLTKDQRIVRNYYRDPFCTYMFTLNGYKGLMETVLFDCQQAAFEKVPKTLPVFIISGDQDPVGDLGLGVRTVDSMFRKAHVHDVTMKLYVDDRHEILNETDREDVYKDILEWAEKRI